MAKRHLISLPAQELSALLCAVNAPHLSAFFDQLPAFRAALQAPVDDSLRQLAYAAQEAIRDAVGNTQYPEDWDDTRELVTRLIQQKEAQEGAQAGIAARPLPKAHGNKTCVCCGGSRIATVYSKACNGNYFGIPHLGFEVSHGYMPSNMGVPGSGDGPELEVCLDCGRVVNGVYPLPDDTLKARIAEYTEGLL